MFKRGLNLNEVVQQARDMGIAISNDAVGNVRELQEAFKANFVDVTWVPLTNLTKGYGAAHCMTQILDDGDVLF